MLFRKGAVEAQEHEVGEFAPALGHLCDQMVDDVVPVVTAQDRLQLQGEVPPARTSRLDTGAREE